MARPRRALARVHRHYAGVIQARRERTGHFWRGRVGTAVLDEKYLAAALRNVSQNPVGARLVDRACSTGCAPPKASADRSATIAFSPAANGAPAVPKPGRRGPKPAQREDD